MHLCTRWAAETGALGERLAKLLRPGDVVVLTGDLGTGKTVLAKGIGRGLGVTEPVVSPTFTIMREYDGDLPLLHLDVYRLDHLQEAIDLGLDELLDEGRVTVVEWGEAVGAVLPTDRLEVLLALLPPEEADDDVRIVELRAAGPSWEARRPDLEAAARPEAEVLLLALDTATPRVSVAFGRNGEVLGDVSLDGGRRHAEQLAPAIEYLCGELDVDLNQLAAIAVGLGPGLFTGLRVGVTTARVMAQSLRIPVIGVPSLDLVAYPLRHTSRLVVPVVDARRAEVFFACDRPVQGGVQRITEYEVRSPHALAGELAALGEDTLLAGGRALRYRDELGALDRVEPAGPGAGAPERDRGLVELATARYEREEFSAPDEVHPLYLRRSDAEIEWERRGR